MCYNTVIKLSVTCIIHVLFSWGTGVAQISFWFPDLDHLGYDAEPSNICGPGAHQR